MKFMLKYTLVLAGMLTLSSVASGQKFGYLNSAALLQEMPEVKEAESNLEVLQKQLQAKGQQMLQSFQQKYLELERKNSQGEISPKELEAESAKLKEEETKIAQFEQDMQNQIFEKRNTLLEPILNKVNDAIKAVAEEEGYAYIFDASPGSGILLYADESTDVYDKVKAKLGL
ncbi:MAG: OmpH family outer membrane protein [Saprospiraceae bacterium]|nr:OmpH family outer membrane protein [Saprospiraceae bacterium]